MQPTKRTILNISITEAKAPNLPLRDLTFIPVNPDIFQIIPFVDRL
jgi:hypothetical protein